MADSCNLLDCLMEMCEYIQSAQKNDATTKKDLGDSCEQRCLFMIRTAMSSPYTTSLSLNDWKIMKADVAAE